MDGKKDKKQTHVKGSEEVKKLKTELEEARKQYLRALADYHNLEKRMYDVEGELGKHTVRKIMLKLLPFLDNLEKAEVFVSDPGLKLIKDQFEKTLLSEGLEEVDVLGKEFNPMEAEAVDTVPSDEDNVVAEVIQKGYQLFGKVVRPAQVKVTKRV